MAKAKRLKPRKRWTNRLAWSVWKIARNNKTRAGKVIEEVCRWFSDFNGTSSYAESTARIIDLDAADPSFNLKWYGRLDGNGTHFSQNIGTTNVSKEFQVYSLNSITIVLGGVPRTAFGSTLVTANTGYGMLEVDYNHATATITVSKDNVLLQTTTSIVIGTARESTAKFKYMARSNGSIDSEGFLKTGQMADVIITHNNTVVNLPMSEGLKDINGEVLYWNETAPVDSRFYLDFMDGVADIAFNTVTLNGEFELELDYKLNTTANGDDCFLSENGDGSNNFFRVDVANQSYDLKIGITFYPSDGQFVIDTEQTTVILKRDSADKITVTSKGVTSLIATDPAEIIFELIGMRAGGITNSFDGQLSNTKIWDNGDRNTGTLILDMPINDYSNVIANNANPLGSNVWDDQYVTVRGESEILGGGEYRVYSSGGSYSAVRIEGTPFTDKDFYLELTVVSGDILDIIPMETNINFTGWENVYDEKKQPIPNRFRTLCSTPSYNYIQLKRLSGVTDVTVKNVVFKEAIDYGVLNGARNSDYNWTSSAPHAIGYNVTTTRDPDCPLLDLFVGGVLQADGTLQDSTILGQP